MKAVGVKLKGEKGKEVVLVRSESCQALDRRFHRLMIAQEYRPPAHRRAGRAPAEPPIWVAGERRPAAIAGRPSPIPAKFRPCCCAARAPALIEARQALPLAGVKPRYPTTMAPIITR